MFVTENGDQYRISLHRSEYEDIQWALGKAVDYLGDCYWEMEDGEALYERMKELSKSF